MAGCHVKAIHVFGALTLFVSGSRPTLSSGETHLVVARRTMTLCYHRFFSQWTEALEMDIPKLPTDLFMILLLASIMTALGCGVVPAGQASSRPFTVSGFSLPVAMVYSSKAEVATSVPSIATSQAGATGFVQRLVMKTVFDVLELQGRSALLPDAVISAILGQLSVNITYEPLDCEEVAITLEEMVGTNPSHLTHLTLHGAALLSVATR
ncbi:hypothetical protein KIN20_032383 [Parelaphostrongylus tenuis]|uniref:Uncharacterized protein n=1 Tax=Parelaphostrongylus tenuis TaxID=148309 RepID=A0AAD5R6I2_PARTN|nr:hypothetical protein KIN20_032383 [Parelaphostrongylus tenuis]